MTTPSRCSISAVPVIEHASAQPNAPYDASRHAAVPLDSPHLPLVGPKHALQTLDAWSTAGVLDGITTASLLKVYDADALDEAIAMLRSTVSRVHRLIDDVLSNGMPVDALLRHLIQQQRQSDRTDAMAITFAVVPSAVNISGTTLALWREGVDAGVQSTSWFLAAAATWLAIPSAVRSPVSLNILRNRVEEAAPSVLLVESKTGLSVAGMTLDKLLRDYLYQSSERRATLTTGHPMLASLVAGLTKQSRTFARTSRDAERRNSLVRLCSAHPAAIALLTKEPLPSGPWTAAVAADLERTGVYKRLLANAPLLLRVVLASYLAGYRGLRDIATRSLAHPTAPSGWPVYRATITQLRASLLSQHGEQDERKPFLAAALKVLAQWEQEPDAVFADPVRVAVRRGVEPTDVAVTPATVVIVDHSSMRPQPAAAASHPGANRRTTSPLAVIGTMRAHAITRGGRSSQRSTDCPCLQIQQVLRWASATPARLSA